MRNFDDERDMYIPDSVEMLSPEEVREWCRDVSLLLRLIDEVLVEQK